MNRVELAGRYFTAVDWKVEGRGPGSSFIIEVDDGEGTQLFQCAVS
jgi:hypothetical protein